MHLIQSLVLLSALAVVQAMPSTGRRFKHDSLVIRSNCQDYLGDCFQNDCNGWFENANYTLGLCSAGTFVGCPCNKCGGGIGNLGECSQNGCEGVDGFCTKGTYSGCPCQH